MYFDFSSDCKRNLLFRLLVAVVSIVFLTSAREGLRAQGVMINEVMASNGAVVADEDGDFEDWVELVNAGNEPVNLTGWGLSDDFYSPLDWRFPDVVIGPGEFLLIWASGKDRLVPSGPLHTNFSIKAGGEELILTRPNGLRVDELPPTAMPTDVSIGRLAGSGEAWVFLDQPTPGTENTATGSGEVLERPAFSPPGGFFAEPVSLTINSSAGETVLYTLDGSEPDPENIGGRSYFYKNSYPSGGFLERTVETFVYDGPIEITDGSGRADPISGINSRFVGSPHLPPGSVFSGTPVRARAFRDGAVPSETETQTFFIHPEAASRYESIPVLSIVTDERNLFDYGSGIYVPGRLADDWWAENSPTFDGWSLANYNVRGMPGERPAHLELFEPGGQPALSQGIGIRAHGGWSRYFSWRKSLRLYARNTYGDTNSFDYPIFPGLNKRNGEGQPLESFRRLILRNSGNDWDGTLLRDAVQQSLLGDLPIDAMTHSRPVAHFINGEFWGLMNLRERMDHHYLESHYGVDPDDAVVLFTVPQLNVPFAAPEPDYSSLPMPNVQVDRGTLADRDNFVAMHDFAVAEDLSDEAALEQIADQMDLENFATYYAIQIYTGNQDWPQNNQDFWRKRLDTFDPAAPPGHDGRWRWMLYDLDFGFDAGAVGRNTLARIVENRNVGGFAPVPWANELFQNLLENPGFRNLFLGRLADMPTIFHPERVSARVDEFNALIEPHRDEHWRRWGNGTNRGNLMKDFAVQRPAYVRAHAQEVFGLAGTVELSILNAEDSGGQVRVSSILLDAETPGTEILAGVNRAVFGAGSDWRFLDDGSNQSDDWRTPGFSDGGWGEGKASFGYGSPGNHGTAIDFGGDPANKPITTYFRKTFTWNHGELPESLDLSLRAKDGAVVYLNGTEVVREQMPDGPINFTTPATPSGDISEWSDLAAWFSADGAMETRNSSSGPAVTEWRDVSGNGRHATQGSDSLQPRVVTDQINGLPVVRFNGSNHFFEAPMEDYRDGMTLFMVARVNEDGGNYDSYFGLNGAGLGNVLYHVGSGGGRGLGITQPNQNLSTTNASSDRFELIRVDADSDFNHRMTRLVSGDSVSVQLTQTGGTVGNLTLGASKNGGEGITDHLSVDIAEVIVFGRELGALESEEIGRYLANKYGLDFGSTMGPETETPMLWLAADGAMETRTEAGERVVIEWRDLSGNGRHAVQAVETRQPRVIDSAIGEKPAIRFNGYADFLEAPVEETRDGMALFLVARVSEEGGPLDSYLGLSGAFDGAVSYHVGSGGGRGLGIAQPGRNLGDNPMDSDRFELIRIDADADYNHRLTRVSSGQSVSGQLTTTSGTASELTLGAGKNSIGRMVNHLAVDIAEVVLYDRELSDDESRGVEAYLAAKYDLELPPAWVNYPLDSNALVPGENVLAVEVHLSSPAAENLFFDARLEGNLPGEIPVWAGIYFRDVPIRVEAVPEFGYRFAGWLGRDEKNPVLNLPLTGDLTLTPLFEVDESGLQDLTPPPHDLAGGAYRFSEWESDSLEGTYPANMVFEQTGEEDPELWVTMDGFWELPYGLTSRSRINGLGGGGFAFINTGNIQDMPGAGYVGSALLALDTRQQDHIQVTWTGGTVLPNSRTYGLRLQYRLDATEPFADVPGEDGLPVEYISRELAGHSEIIGPILLPPEVEDQPYVQLRWKYYYIGGDSGPRAQLRIGDILVTSGQSGEASKLVFEDVTLEAIQSGQILPSVSVRAFDDSGRIAADFFGTIRLELFGDGELLGTLERDANDGSAVFDDLAVVGAGEMSLRAYATGVEAAVLANFRVVRMTELVMPRFIQGEQDVNGDNLNRLPFAFRLALEGLVPGAVYRYGNRIVADDDSLEQDGAGNALYVTGAERAWIRNMDAPSFLEVDLDVRHHEFIADGDGEFRGWFVTEPSGNARFTPGNQVWVRLLLNDGAGGEETHHILTAKSLVKVLRLGRETGEATGLIGESEAGAKHFVLLFDNEEGLGRPMAAVPVEQTGAELDDRYARFYQDRVSTVPGRWGAFVPNLLPSGVRRIEERSLEDGSLRAVRTFPDGIATTVNPSGGSDTLDIGKAESYAAWVESAFANVEDRENPEVSGPWVDASGEGVPNILRYALGIEPGANAQRLLPQTAIEEKRLRFDFRRDASKVGVAYIVEATSAVEGWDEVLYDSRVDRQDNTDGEIMRVADPITVEEAEEGRRFLRLRVELMEP